MKSGTARAIAVIFCLIFLSVNVFADNNGDNEIMFMNNWGTYRIPVIVGQSIPLDAGLLSVISFARDHGFDDIWIYAFEPQNSRNEGEDRFVRFFEEEHAHIVVNWHPIKVDRSLSEHFEEWQRISLEIFKERKVALEIEGEIEESEISGYPSLGAKYKIEKGNLGFFTIWLIKAEDVDKWFFLTFFYTGGFADPAGIFARVKKEIVFLKTK